MTGATVGSITWPKTSGPAQLALFPSMLLCSGSFHTWRTLELLSALATTGCVPGLSDSSLTIRLVCATVTEFLPLVYFRFASGAGTGISLVRILCAFAEELALSVKKTEYQFLVLSWDIQ